MGPCPPRWRPRPLTRWTRSPRRWRPGSRKAAPVQLHPGDLGWNWRLGAEDLAGAVRVWRRDGQILAVGLVEDRAWSGWASHRASIGTMRSRRSCWPICRIPRGACCPPTTRVSRPGPAPPSDELLTESGWVADEPWTPLSRDLTDPVEDCGLRVEVVDAHHAQERVEVQRAAFPNSTFTLERWHTMATASPYRRARCLVAYDSNERRGRRGDGLVGGPRDGRACSNHSGCTGTIAATGSARPSHWRRPPRCRRWAPPARPCAHRAATSAPWRRTPRPASDGSRPSPTSAGRADSARSVRTDATAGAAPPTASSRAPPMTRPNGQPAS